MLKCSHPLHLDETTEYNQDKRQLMSNGSHLFSEVGNEMGRGVFKDSDIIYSVKKSNGVF